MIREEICDLRLLILAEQDLYNKNSEKFTDGQFDFDKRIEIEKFNSGKRGCEDSDH